VSNLVIVSGDFSSGSTLLFTLFRKSGSYYSLYEPLHQKLPEYLIWPLQAYEHHFFVGNYFDEYRGLTEIPRLFSREWGEKNFYLAPEADADELYRYLTYLIGTSFGRSPNVMLKENRLTFRLGWIRAKFPNAKIIHIARDRDSQWNSVVRRVQAFRGREDVGQDDVNFHGFNVAEWCEDLKGIYPELAAENSQTGYERFSKLWELSRAEHLRYADISINYRSLVDDFQRTMGLIGECVGHTFDTQFLEQFVVAPERQQPLAPRGTGLGGRLSLVLDRAGRRYASSRLALGSRLRATQSRTGL